MPDGRLAANAVRADRGAAGPKPGAGGTPPVRGVRLSPSAPLTPAQVAETRATLDAFADAVVVAPGVRIDEAEAGGCPALRAHRGPGTASAVGLLLHGGGYRAGSPGAARGVASHLAVAADADLLVPAYRLAPEHPFPAAVHDVVAALAQLADDHDPARTFVVGESAGGGLAVAGLLAARAAGVPSPGALVLLSPWLDLTAASASYERLADRDPIISRDTSLRSAEAYLGGHDPRDPLASPAFASDAALAGLPRTLLQVSEDEVLLDEVVAFHRRLVGIGVDAHLERTPGVTHLWHVAVPDEGPASAAIDAVGKYIKNRSE